MRLYYESDTTLIGYLHSCMVIAIEVAIIASYILPVKALTWRELKWKVPQRIWREVVKWWIKLPLTWLSTRTSFNIRKFWGARYEIIKIFKSVFHAHCCLVLAKLVFALFFFAFDSCLETKKKQNKELICIWKCRFPISTLENRHIYMGQINNF